MQATAAPEPQSQPATQSAAQPATQPTPRHAGRRPSLWWSALWAFVGLLVFIVIFNFLLPDLGRNMSDFGMITLGLIFSLVPALLWLIVFYRIDAREPEPMGMVLSVYGVALLIAAALYQVVLYGLFDIDRWLYTSWWAQLLGEVLLVGALGMGIVYATVRIVVLMHPEFDERLDGIVYAMAAGLGVATVVNFSYVLQHGGVDLGIGSIRMVTNALGYGAFAGVLGYFIGQARFEKTPAWYLPLGVGIAAALTGFYFFVLDQSAGNPFGGNGWRDLLLAAFLALVALGAVAFLVQRTNEETDRVAHLDRESSAWMPAVRIAPVATVTGVMLAHGETPATLGGKAAAAAAVGAEPAAAVAAAPAGPASAEPAPAEAAAPAVSSYELPEATAPEANAPVVGSYAAPAAEAESPAPAVPSYQLPETPAAESPAATQPAAEEKPKKRSSKRSNTGKEGAQ